MSQYVIAIIKDKSKLQDRCDEANLKNPIEINRITKVVNDLKDTLRANTDLVALSAPQIGYKDRVFCIRFANGDIRAFINPMLICSIKSIHLSRESNPSIPNVEYIIPRADEIEVAYQTPLGHNESNKFTGAPADIFQQMLNMIDGVLLDDLGLEVLPGFDDASEDDKTKIIQMYLESLKAKQSLLDKEVEANPDLKKTRDAIRFMTDVALGKVEYQPMTKEETDKVIKDIQSRQDNKQ
jgi:peptide deformylase